MNTRPSAPPSPSPPWLMALIRYFVSGDIARARKRMRNAAIAGFVFSGQLLFGALIFFSGVTEEGSYTWSAWQVMFPLAEGVLMLALAFGMARRNRGAALALFGYFWASRPVFIALGFLAHPVTIVMHMAFGYFFLQGLRGALTYYRLTHPQYPPPAAEGKTAPE